MLRAHDARGDDGGTTMTSRGSTTGDLVRTVGALGTVGLSFVLAIAIGTATGWWLDGKLGTSPWMFFVFFFLGLAAGVLNVYRITSRYLKSPTTASPTAAAPPTGAPRGRAPGVGATTSPTPAGTRGRRDGTESP
jgi:hypothetical protein